VDGAILYYWNKFIWMKNTINDLISFTFMNQSDKKRKKIKKEKKKIEIEIEKEE